MSAESWSRIESRLVRPFTDISQALNSCQLRLERDGEFSDKASFDLSEINPEDFSMATRIPDIPTLHDLDLPRDDLKVIVVVNDNRLKCSDVVAFPSLDQVSTDYEFSEKDMRRFSWTGNFSTDVALVLADNRQVEADKPYLAGTGWQKRHFPSMQLLRIPLFRSDH
jgi:hypothetical protein